MAEEAFARAAGPEAFLVGGAVRDELLGRPVLDVDIACPEPERAARAYQAEAGGAVFPLSERHGAWRVAFRDGRTIDFTPLPEGIEADLRTRDFTVNAIARPLGSREHVDPHGGLADLDARRLRVVTEDVFRDDPLRLLRAVRLEDELELPARPGRRGAGPPRRRPRRSAGRRADPRGAPAALGRGLPPAGRAPAARAARAARPSAPPAAERADHPDYLLVLYLGESLLALPVSNETRRFAARLLGARPPADDSPREIHRFRRRTEPWALEALAYLGAGRYADAVVEARAREPAEPLLRGDELGVDAGPEIGRLLELVEEERAVGTISTREEALELVRQELSRRT